MKMQKKFIVKVISALCATGAMATTITPTVSANPPKKLIAGQTGDVNDNQNENEIIDNNQKIDPIKMYTTVAAINENIIDENSQDPKNIERNNGRKRVNHELLREMMGIYTSDESDQSVDSWNLINLQLRKTGHSVFRQIVKEHVKDEFDRFMYFQTLVLDKYEDISSYLSENEDEISGNDKGEISGNDEGVNFNFLITKAKISKMLLEQEKDLIKKFLLEIECQDVLKAVSNDPTNLLKQFKNPYYCKQAIETFYCNVLKKYYKNDNIEYDINANNLKTKKEACKSALLDAENQTESVLDGKDEIFKQVYCETLALANAEIDAKAHRGRQNKLIKNKNRQQIYKKIYDDQYNEVMKQIGVHDGKTCSSHIIFQNDPIAAQNYDEGYLKSVRKEARENGFIMDFDYTKYDWDEAQKAYFQYFAESLEERGFLTFSRCSHEFVLNDPEFKDFLKSDCKNNQELINFKENTKKRYIEGCLKGLKECGRKFAHANEMDKKKYAFENISTKQSDFGEFYNDFKAAFEQGVKEGLKDLNEKNKSSH